MSKNFPHDNIYSILGKLDALKPTPAEERFALVKEIRESVEAQGSVLEGVSAVEAKLARQFAESDFSKMSAAIQKTGKSKASADAITAAAGREKLGQKEMTRRSVAGRKDEQSDMEECTGCAIGECSVHGMAEGEITRKPGVTKHTKTDYPGYPTDDTEDSLDNLSGPGTGRKGRPRKAQTKNPRPVVGAEKKGRGRPSKVPTVKSPTMPHDPFGRVSSIPKGTPGKVHTMSESIMESVNFKRMMEEQHMTLEEMLECMNADMMQFKESGVCSDRLRDMMEVYSHAKRQMEETQGGIGHDLVTPQQRVAQATPQKPGIVGTVKDVVQGAKNWIQGKPEQGPTYEEVDPLEEELSKLAELAGITMAGEGNAFTGKLASTPKGGTFKVGGKEFTDTSSLEEAGIENDLRDRVLAVLETIYKGAVAGEEMIDDVADELGDHFTAVKSSGDKTLKQAYGLMRDEGQEAEGNPQLMASIAKKAIGMLTQLEGNAFGKAVRDAKADGIQPGEKVTVGGKEYAVREAQELVAMLRVAGLDTKQLEEALAKNEATYGDTEVDGEDEEVEEELANAPDEEYMSMKASTLNPGEADSGEKQMNPDRPTFKNGDNALSKPPVREATIKLEDRLAAEYESIKKVS